MTVGKRNVSAAAVFFLVFCAVARPEEPLTFSGYKAVRVEPRNQADVDTIEASGVIILNCIHGVGPIDLIASPDQLAGLRRLPVPIQITEQDVGAKMAQMREVAAVAGSGDPFDDFFLDFHPYGASQAEVSSIRWYMNELAVRYPALASVVSIGTTHEGRTIYGLRVTSNVVSQKPGALYFGAEHAREWMTPPVPLFFARHLLENYGVDPNITDLVDNVEFFLVPVFNVDGYLYTWSTNRYWRKNRRLISGSNYGVDLNRNWGEGWGGQGSSGSASNDTYRGPSPFSEIETQGLRNFFIAHPNVRAQLDIHSFSQLILWPWGYTNALPPFNTIFQQIGFGMRDAIFGVHSQTYISGPTYTTIYPAAGVSVDWTFAQQGLVSLAFEVRPSQFACGGLECFAPPPTEIIPNCEEMLAGLLFLSNSPYVRDYQAPTPQVLGQRYLRATANFGAGKQAFRITSPDYPCLEKYIMAGGALSDSAEYRTAMNWGPQSITGMEIVPGKRYVVEALYADGASAAAIEVATPQFGDIVAPFGEVGFLDISAIVDRYLGDPLAPPLELVDIAPQHPDGVVDFLDVSLAVDAFRNHPYPYATPDCP